MGEHQIIIRLTREQYQAVQRLAQLAGLSSAHAFARQELLKALGLMAPSTSGMKRVTGELNRLHRELQVFIAESLPNDDYTGTGGYPPLPMEENLSDNMGHAPGPILSPAHEDDYTENAVPPPSDMVASAFPAQEDNLEELADRAFASSPRLGALDPTVVPVERFLTDPLQDLLDENAPITTPLAGKPDEPVQDYVPPARDDKIDRQPVEDKLDTGGRLEKD